MKYIKGLFGDLFTPCVWNLWWFGTPYLFGYTNGDKLQYYLYEIELVYGQSVNTLLKELRYFDTPSTQEESSTLVASRSIWDMIDTDRSCPETEEDVNELSLCKFVKLSTKDISVDKKFKSLRVVRKTDVTPQRALTTLEAEIKDEFGVILDTDLEVECQYCNQYSAAEDLKDMNYECHECGHAILKDGADLKTFEGWVKEFKILLDSREEDSSKRIVGYG